MSPGQRVVWLFGVLRDEAAAYVEEHADERDDYGHRLVARNGYKKQRAIETGVGSARRDLALPHAHVNVGPCPDADAPVLLVG